jgi:glycosyltransferase involved in cell wall biosynthesis
MNDLTVVIPFWNGSRTIAGTISSLPSNIPIIVVKDAGGDDPPEMNFDNVQIIRLEKRGYFSGAVNVGVDSCKTDALILNQDVRITGMGWLNLIEENRAKYATIGDGVMNHPAWPNGYVQGTFMFIRRDAWDKIGKFNERDYPLWGSTCEWQLRACRAGYKALPTKIPGLQHRHSERFGNAITKALKQEREKAHWFIRTPPMISVIVPCYNYGRYLGDAINSLVGGPTCLGEMESQKFQGFEVIIVDDASTDDTARIAQSLADPWQGIHYLKLEENRGTAGAINAGIEASHGKLITILSADDMAEKNHLEEMCRASEKNPHSVIYTDLTVFRDGKRVQGFKLPEYDFEELLYRNQMSAAIMFPRRAWEELGGYPEAMRYGREDWAFNVGLGANGWCGVHISEPTYLYRREKHSRSFRTGNVHRHESEQRENDLEKARQWKQFYERQLIALYPNLYGGERPMGCCGGRGSRRGRQTAASTTAVVKELSMPGQDGMALLEYVGGNAGKMTFWGPETNTRYVFGGSKKVGYVDTADVAGMVGMRDSRRPVFQAIGRDVMPEPTPEMVEVAQPKEEAVVSGEPSVEPPDDLMTINGVGHSLAERMIAAGYTNISAIAAASPDYLAEKIDTQPWRAKKIVEAARAL